jgi:hypothetical protein
MSYAVPAHHLAAPRPAPISFEAARAEAELLAAELHDGAKSDAAAHMTAPLEAAAQTPQKTEAA